MNDKNDKNDNLIRIYLHIYKIIRQKGYEQGLKEKEFVLYNLKTKNKKQRTKIRTIQKEIKRLKKLLKN